MNKFIFAQYGYVLGFKFLNGYVKMNEVVNSYYVNDYLEEKILELLSGDFILLKDEGDRICAYLLESEDPRSSTGKIGGIVFDRIEYPDGYGHFCCQKVTWMYLDGFKGKFVRRGIGTAIVHMRMETQDEVVEFGENDGMRRDDSSHLTGNGPAFAESIKQKVRDGILKLPHMP